MAVRLGLIGCGAVGQKHVQALAHLDGAELTATVDQDRDRAEAAALPFDATAFTSADSLYKSGLVDAVVIATPSGTHPEIAFQAMEQGLDVLVEKPLALSYRDAVDLTRFADDAGVLLAVTHFNRMLPGPAVVLDAVRSGRLGRLLSGGVDVRWARPQAYYDEAPWRGTRAMDGGVLFNQAIHALDLLVQVFGRADEVFCYADTKTHRIEAEDVVTGAVHFESGAVATVNVTTSVPEKNLEECITVVGESGVAVLGPQNSALQVLRTGHEDDDGRIMDELKRAEPWPSWRSHWNALADFVQAVESRRPPALHATTTLDVLALVEALTRSGLSGRPVRIDELNRERGLGSLA
jgi:UDP-N-acetyl-2-amino-2-deoxyglucuronate dehydrogenase